MIMNTRSLADYLEPLLAPDLEHIQNIRIGTKSVAYWPQRFVSDRDADDLMRLFERVVKAAARTWPSWATTAMRSSCASTIAQQAVKRIVGTGATCACRGR